MVVLKVLPRFLIFKRKFIYCRFFYYSKEILVETSAATSKTNQYNFEYFTYKADTKILFILN